MSVVCPHCQTRVEGRHKFGTGPVYASRRNVALRGRVDEANGIVYRDEDMPLVASFPLTGDNYGIAICGECRREFVVDQRGPVWPLPRVAAPLEIPEQVRQPYIEAMKAHAVGAETAALLAARTALIRMQREQKIAQIKDLVDAGKITGLVWAQADEVRMWANATGHDEEPPVPASEDVDQLL
jgi:hypothetical protein